MKIPGKQLIFRPYGTMIAGVVPGATHIQSLTGLKKMGITCCTGIWS
jgi:hypothetical protein